jgi:AcrR family transcriptional regulator
MAATLRETAANLYRTAILDAAERVFATTGLADAKITDIAREAGMAVGTLYNYFEGKEEIVRTLLEVRGNALIEELEQVARTVEDPISRLAALIDARCTFIQGHIGIVSIYAHQGARNELSIKKICGPGVEERYRKSLSITERAVKDAVKAGQLRKDLPVADLVAGLTGMVNGFIFGWVQGGQKTPLACGPAVLKLFVEGAAP